MDPSELLKIAMGSPSNIHTTFLKVHLILRGGYINQLGTIFEPRFRTLALEALHVDAVVIAETYTLLSI